jgi:hypothetical protein
MTAITTPITTVELLTAHLATLPTGSADAPTTVPLSLALSNVWGAINTAVTGKYVILDLSACTATNNTIAGAYDNLSDNSFNVIKTNTYIKGIILPNTLTTIGEYAFNSCSALTTVSIPDGVTTIGNFAFVSTALTSVTIPGGVTSIGTNAFYNCTALTTVIFATGSNISSTWNANAFPSGTALWTAYNTENKAGTYTRTDTAWAKTAP